MKNILIACLLFATHSFAQDTTQHYKLVRSAGRLPMLAYSLGEDRLGGAKLGYIDTLVLLKVIDSTKDMYKVQLSKYRTAFIEKPYVKTDSVTKPRPYYLTGSWMIKSEEEGYDVVTMGMDEKLPYKSWMEINPSKIMIELYGVQSNTNWITQLQSAKEVKNVYFEQVEDDVVRATIELNHKQHWGYSIAYKNKVLTIRIKQQPKALLLKNMVVAIDAGHGGTNSGASGSTQDVIEKDYTLKFAQALEKQLKRNGVKVIMTRTKDTTIDNRDRVLFLQQQRPDLLVSLHLNSAGNTTVQGVSTYYKHIGYRPLTVAIIKRMLEIPGVKEFGNVGNFNFLLNAPTDFPNSLVEIGFLSNVDDEKRIKSAKFQKDVAKKIYLALMDFLAKNQ